MPFVIFITFPCFLSLLKVAKDHCIRDCIRCSQIICNTQGDSESKVKFENVLENGLTSNIPEVRAEVLDCLLEGVSNSSLILSESLQVMFVCFFYVKKKNGIFFCIQFLL